MYGKIFEDIFCSTLMDFGGDTAYVFIAMIVLSDENGILKHTPESLARVICKDPEAVKRAVTHLEAEDPDSNLKAHNGRRIVPLNELNEDETRGWFVVNKEHYRDKKDLEEIRTQTRERVRRFRERNAEKRSVTLRNAEKRHTDTDTDSRKAPASKSRRSPKVPIPDNFAVSDRVRRWAAERGITNLDAHFEHFVGKAKAKGYTYADWDEGLMGAIRDDWAKVGNGKSDLNPFTAGPGKAVM